MNPRYQLLAAILTVITTSDHLFGGVITSPISVIANELGQLGGSQSPGNLIDQSGLSSGFVSGTTDFNSYIGGGPTHSSNSSAGAWVSSFMALDGRIDFDLGSTQVIQQVALWNGTSGSTAAIDEFVVFTSDDSTFTTSTNVGTFNNAQNDGLDPFPVSVFDLTDSTARFARIQINSNHGSNVITGMGEIAFDTVSAVPEPATFGLFSVGAVGLHYRRRRRRADVQE